MPKPTAPPAERYNFTDVPTADDQRTDGELLHAHLAGDRYAFGELVERHRRVLWSVAVRAMDSAEDAAEAVQDGLLRAHQGAVGFRGEANVRNWLVRIVVNACRDRYRYNRARPALPPRGTTEVDVPAPRNPIEDHELRLDVEQALRRLPMDQRLAVVLVDVQGYSVAEAAQMLRVPAGTVKSRCSRARARLGELLRPGTPAAATGERP
ncbi:RNA polymerase sigma factor SigM [Pseudonocardia eucalypti]|uniref:RNA polymerase sigma factor SigM n=1 Tax=Pseudonocardia eucalypti TaxID=648755 RepID=A0ABP9PCV1_9PSEU|nr:RNA polymerase sigma-70 factor (ECF subfamily) [Pseudonocardia eucalypti]